MQDSRFTSLYDQEDSPLVPNLCAATLTRLAVLGRLATES